MAAAILVLGGALLFAGQWLLARWERLAVRRQSFSLEDLLGTAATVAGLAVISWWVLSFAAAFTAVLLEQSGKPRQAAATAKFCPTFMRRLAVAVLGLNLIGIPVANAEPSAESPAWYGRSDTSSAAERTPGAGRMPGPAAKERESSAQIVRTSPEWSVSHRPESLNAPLPTPDPQWKPRPPVTSPGLLGTSPQRQGSLPSQLGKEVVVGAGDTLWTIAAKDLGPAANDVEIALHWPRWYEANRSVIGDDPDVLLPGQVLRPPVGLPSTTPPLS